MPQHNAYFCVPFEIELWNYHAFYSSTCGKKAANRTVRLRPWYYYPTYMGLFSGLLWMSQCALDDYSLSFFALLFVHFYWLFSVVVIVFQTLRAWQKNYISWLHQKRNSFIGKRFGGKKVVWPLSDQSENTYIVNILWWQYQKHA